MDNTVKKKMNRSLPTSFLFYDTETTGTQVCFDQIIQFAAIRTDTQLNELARYAFDIRLNPDSIMHPKALLVHKISPERLKKNGITEYEAARKIHTLFNTPNTISIGYNTLGFDDEFLRFMFYRNLLTPYTHQYQNACFRMDLYPIMAHNNPKATSLKLENLAHTFNIPLTGSAHDALVDVEATIALAKTQNIYPTFIQHFQKNQELYFITHQLIGGLKTKNKHFTQAILIDGIFGRENQYRSVGLSLGQHRHYKNQYCFLRLDLPALQEATLDTFQDHCWVIQKKLTEPPFLQKTNTNTAQHLTPTAFNTITKNKNFLKKNPDLLEAIQEHYLDYIYPEIENVDVDAQLYLNGFSSSEMQNLKTKFHASPEHQKEEIVAQMPEPLKSQASRLIRRMRTISLEDLLPSPRIDYKGVAQITRSDVDIILNEIYAKETLSESDQQLLQSTYKSGRDGGI